jgi:hypothetical protein
LRQQKVKNFGRFGGAVVASQLTVMTEELHRVTQTHLQPIHRRKVDRPRNEGAPLPAAGIPALN